MAYDKVLDALGDPTRRQIVDILAAGPLPVGKIADMLPVSRPAVSQHLNTLLEAGIVERSVEGRRHLYRLRREGFAAVREYFDRLWDLPLRKFAEAARRKSGDSSASGDIDKET